MLNTTFRRLAGCLATAAALGACSGPSDGAPGDTSENAVAGGAQGTANRTVWSPLDQLHATGAVSPVPDHPANALIRAHILEDVAAVVNVGFRAKRGVAVRTAERALNHGNYAFVMQLYHSDGVPVGTRLGSVHVRVDGRVATAEQPVLAREIASDDDDREWQRELLAFDVDHDGAKVSFEFTWDGGIDATAKTGLVRVLTGFVTLTKPARPFYHIAHNPNSIELVDAALAGGANAIEPDVQFEKRPGEGAADLDVREAGPEFTAPVTHNDVATDFDEYAGAMAQRMPPRRQDNPLLLILWDVKPTKEISSQAFGRIFVDRATRAIPPERQVVSLQETNMADFFDAIPRADGNAPTMGMDVSAIASNPVGKDPNLWASTAEQLGLSFVSMGITNILDPQQSLWFGAMSGLVNSRDRLGHVKKTYYWTAGKKAEMRRMLDLGVDGIIVDDHRALEDVLAEEPYRTLYRKATAADSQFTAHGFPFGPAD